MEHDLPVARDVCPLLFMLHVERLSFVFTLLDDSSSHEIMLRAMVRATPSKRDAVSAPIVFSSFTLVFPLLGVCSLVFVAVQRIQTCETASIQMELCRQS